MSKEKTIKKKKDSVFRLILLSLFISFFILYLIAVSLWGVYGYDKALWFFSSLLKANQVSLNGLGEGFLSDNITAKISALLSDASVMAKAERLLHAGAEGLKSSLSGFVSEDVISDALQEGAGFFHKAYLFILKAGLLFALVLKIFFIKAFLLIAALPLFALLGLVGLVDGLSQREIRRSELGRESSYLFHMLNKWLAKIIGIGLCLWVCLPINLNPQWFFVPLGLLFALMLSLSASKFKKYL